MSRIALITGATSGIGKATAIAFANNGINLILCGRRQDRLDSLKEQFSKKVLITTLKFDVSNKVEVFSAGSEPTSIHPLAIKVMLSRGIDLSQHRSKHMEEFLGQKFDYVITVCDKVREVCPMFPGDPEKTHWSFPDPAEIEGNLQKQEQGFEDTARELTIRIQYLLLMIDRKIKEQG